MLTAHFALFAHLQRNKNTCRLRHAPAHSGADGPFPSPCPLRRCHGPASSIPLERVRGEPLLRLLKVLNHLLYFLCVTVAQTAS